MKRTRVISLCSQTIENVKNLRGSHLAVFLFWEEPMLKSCSICGGIHTRSESCPRKQPRQKTKTHIDKFRTGRSWRNKSLAIRQRDTYLCQYCFSLGKINYDHLEVHHIVPIVKNWDLRLEDDNLITLCSACHTLAETGEISRDLLFHLSQKRNESGISHERN